jgi:hypothetical protein
MWTGTGRVLNQEGRHSSLEHLQRAGQEDEPSQKSVDAAFVLSCVSCLPVSATGPPASTEHRQQNDTSPTSAAAH